MTQTLKDFQARGHELYTCFVFAAAGLNKTAETFRSLLTGDPNQTMFVGSTDPAQGICQAKIKVQDLVSFSRKDGLYTDILAKSLIVSLYSEWDELYRHRLANELEVEASAIKADLMGDIRHIRNWIVHNKSIVGKNPLKVLPWKLTEGSLLTISEKCFEQFMDELNKMDVNVALAQPGA